MNAQQIGRKLRRERRKVCEQFVGQRVWTQYLTNNFSRETFLLRGDHREIREVEGTVVKTYIAHEQIRYAIDTGEETIRIPRDSLLEWKVLK